MSVLVTYGGSTVEKSGEAVTYGLDVSVAANVERTLVVRAEERRVTVEAEERTLVVEA